MNGMKRKLTVLGLVLLMAAGRVFALTVSYTDFNAGDYKEIESLYYIEEDSAICGAEKYCIVTKLMDYSVDASGRQIVSVLTDSPELFGLVHRGDQLPNVFGIEENSVKIYLHIEHERELIYVIDAVEVLNHKFLFNTSYMATENLNIREKPAKNGKKIMLLQASSYVTILEVGKKETVDGVESNWVKIRYETTGKTVEGWCFGAYLERSL